MKYSFRFARRECTFRINIFFAHICPRGLCCAARRPPRGLKRTARLLDTFRCDREAILIVVENKKRRRWKREVETEIRYSRSFAFLSFSNPKQTLIYFAYTNPSYLCIRICNRIYFLDCGPLFLCACAELSQTCILIETCRAVGVILQFYFSRVSAGCTWCAPPTLSHSVGLSPPILLNLKLSLVLVSLSIYVPDPLPTRLKPLLKPFRSRCTLL